MATSLSGSAVSFSLTETRVKRSHEASEAGKEAWQPVALAERLLGSEPLGASGLSPGGGPGSDYEGV